MKSKIDKFACDLCALGEIAKVRRKKASLLIVRTILLICTWDVCIFVGPKSVSSEIELLSTLIWKNMN